MVPQPEFVCKALKNHGPVHSPTGRWEQGVPKNCAQVAAEAWFIEKGELKYSGIVKISWPAEGLDVPGRNMIALIKVDENLKPNSILKVIGALADIGEMSGETSLEFATDHELVLMFRGYVSQWQISLRRMPGAESVLLEELR